VSASEVVWREEKGGLSEKRKGRRYRSCVEGEARNDAVGRHQTDALFSFRLCEQVGVCFRCLPFAPA
jgi:hypothetical protein